MNDDVTRNIQKLKHSTTSKSFVKCEEQGYQEPKTRPWWGPEHYATVVTVVTFLTIMTVRTVVTVVTVVTVLTVVPVVRRKKTFKL